MIYALVMAGIVVNTAVIKDQNIVDAFKKQYDCVVSLGDNLDHIGMRWTTKDCKVFEPPVGPDGKIPSGWKTVTK